MKPGDRDRLVILKNAKKRVITQQAAAEELGLSVRQVKRLLYALNKRGDKAVIHGLRGKSSNRQIEEGIRKQAVKILSAPVYEGFGPTLAAEYLASTCLSGCFSKPLAVVGSPQMVARPDRMHPISPRI